MEGTKYSTYNKRSKSFFLFTNILFLKHCPDGLDLHISSKKKILSVYGVNAYGKRYCDK